MKQVMLLLVLLSVGVSCHKDRSLQEVVFKGRYLGTGCWPVIQVISPSITAFDLDPSALKWAEGDTVYHNAIGADISEQFSTGAAFYFTVDRVKPHGIIPADCISTKYILSVGHIAFTKTALQHSDP